MEHSTTKIEILYKLVGRGIGLPRDYLSKKITFNLLFTNSILGAQVDKISREHIIINGLNIPQYIC